MAKARDTQPDGLARAAKDAGEDGILARDQEDDVEGHMFVSPTMGRELAKARSAEIDRSVRSRKQESEAKRVFRR